MRSRGDKNEIMIRKAENDYFQPFSFMEIYLFITPET